MAVLPVALVYTLSTGELHVWYLLKHLHGTVKRMKGGHDILMAFPLSQQRAVGLWLGLMGL